MGYRLVYGLLYGFSLLPLRFLYLISDGIYFLIYHVFGYRTGVVRSNLLIAFPEKTAEERKKIEKQFYKNFVDNFIETLKLLSGGDAFAKKHFQLNGTEMDRVFLKGKKMQCHLGHNFNWELANIGITGRTHYPILTVYMPVKNEIFDRLMIAIRSVSGNGLVPATNMKNAMLPYRNTQYFMALVADQVPGDPSKAYWMNFFGRPTPFVRGAERGAVAGNLAVAFGSIVKIKRGYYRFDYEICTEAAGDMPKGEITRRYVRFLEKAIRNHPEVWLWSHRRWKREWNPAYEKSWIDDQHPVPKPD